GAGLRALRARAGRGELRGHHLVEHGHVGLDAEDGVVELDGAGRGARTGAHVDLGHLYRPPFTASRMSTSPPRGPGTAPLMSSRSRSASACTTSRFSVVTRWWPTRPAIRVPLNTRDGVAQAPMAPGPRCTLWVPWEAPRPEKLCRF